MDNVEKTYNLNSSTLPFGLQQNALSNMHHIDIRYKDMYFKSAEHISTFNVYNCHKTTLQKKFQSELVKLKRCNDTLCCCGIPSTTNVASTLSSLYRSKDMFGGIKR